jgi:large subunit ribosomal protein L22
MEIKAKSRYLWISPQKVRQVIPLIKGKNVKAAEDILQLANKKAAYLIHKTMAQAAANARMINPAWSLEDLIIKKVMADGGPMQKRMRPRARGQADTILKRTSHITIVLEKK